MTFNNDFTAIHMNKTKVKLDRLVYVQMSILDLSKHLIFGW